MNIIILITLIKSNDINFIKIKFSWINFKDLIGFIQ